MEMYTVKEAQHLDNEHAWSTQVLAYDAKEACCKAMKRAFNDWGWEDRWIDTSPDWAVICPNGAVLYFTSMTEVEPVFYAFPRDDE